MQKWKKLKGIGIAVVAFLFFTSLGLAQESMFDVVKKRGKLIAGTKYDFPPAGYVDKEGKVVGFDVDILKYIANKLGVELEIKQVTSKTRIPMLVNGNIDMVAAVMNATKKRAEVIDFSIPYYKGGRTILVRKDSGITSIADLESPRKTGSTQGSADAIAFLKLQPKGEVVYFQEHTMAVLALKINKLDAVTTTDVTLHRLNKGDQNYVVIQPTYDPDPWHLGVRHNDSKWRLFLDTTLMEMYANGTLAKLHEKHFVSPISYKIDVWPDILKENL